MEITSFNSATNYSGRINAQVLLRWLLKDFHSMLYKNIAQVSFINVWAAIGVETKTSID